MGENVKKLVEDIVSKRQVLDNLLAAIPLERWEEPLAPGSWSLKDIIAHLGSQEFIRGRMGVGRKPRPDYDLADWVLGKPAAEDRKAIDARYPDAEAACRLLMAGKLAEAQNKYNH